MMKKMKAVGAVLATLAFTASASAADGTYMWRTRTTGIISAAAPETPPPASGAAGGGVSATWQMSGPFRVGDTWFVKPIVSGGSGDYLFSVPTYAPPREHGFIQLPSGVLCAEEESFSVKTGEGGGIACRAGQRTYSVGVSDRQRPELGTTTVSVTVEIAE